jgi:hypothetical protein
MLFVSKMVAGFLPVLWSVLCSISSPVVRCWLWLVFSRRERAAVHPTQPLYPRCPKSFSCPLNRMTKESMFAMKKNAWRAVIEVGFIIFLFYSNLLMGEFERSGMGQKRGVAWAIGDVFTATNFGIATIAAFIGYILFEFFRKKL